MLCGLCETCLTGLIHRNIATWKRLNDEDWYAFRHGDYHTMIANASAGCELCQLFNEIRRQRMRSFHDLAEKWHRQPAVIDVRQSGGPRVFQLLTEAPEKSWIPFEFFNHVSSGQISSDLRICKDFPVPFQVTPGAVSETTVALARRWIDECQRDHSCCARRSGVPLPTRVIDVGGSDQASSARLHVNPGNQQHGKYVTLSHCWGTVNKLTTTRRNIQDFQQAIPLDLLPKTFHDAIILTRLLGMRYLWLDALCIIQDDREDWKRESATMCAVYENAAFSISAVLAPDSDCGLFNRRSDSSCITTIDDTPIGVRPQLDSLNVALSHSKLESRAWCLQERILAPAILHVGPQQWYWECRAAEFSESYPCGSLSTGCDETEAGDKKYRYIPANTSRIGLLDLWYNLVGQYSARDLTEPSDRLPAISGLADRIARELGEPSSYCNGLWASDILSGLLWQRPTYYYRKLIPSRDKYSSRVDFSQQPGRFKCRVAPTWSWAAVRGAVSYGWKITYIVAQSATQSDAHVIKLEANDPVITMTGFLRRGGCTLRGGATSTGKPAHADDVKGNAVFKSSGSLIVDEGVMCILDDTEDIIPKSCYCLRISTWREEQHARQNRKTAAGVKVFYLILERLQGSVDSVSLMPKHANFLGRFRRIGVGYDDPRNVERVFVNAERHMIELV